MRASSICGRCSAADHLSTTPFCFCAAALLSFQRSNVELFDRFLGCASNPTSTHPLPVLLLQVAAFVLGRGALTLPLSLFQFTAVMLAPFMPAEMAADKVSAPQKDDSAALSSGAGQQKASLAGEPTARAAAPASTAAETQTALGGLTPFMLAGKRGPKSFSDVLSAVVPSSGKGVDQSQVKGSGQDMHNSCGW